MNIFKQFLALFILTFINISYSQTGPGGVGNSTNNALWLKGDGLTCIDAGATQAAHGEQIRQWNDVSGNNRHATQTTAGNRPYYEASTTNGMPGLKFTGNSFIDGPALGIGSNSSYTYLMVFKDTQTNPGGMNNGSGDFILDRTSATNGLVSLKPITGNKYGFQKRNNSGGGLGGPLSTTSINTNTKIIELRRNYNVNYQFFYNGNQESTLSDTDGATTPPDPRIGRHATDPNNGLRGFINEFIIYDFALNTAQTIIVNNYLAAKYDLSLSANDLYTQDNAIRGNFDHNVAGIGRASDGTNHTDSRGTGIVKISNPNALSNNEFLFWGEETRNPTYSFSTNTSNYTEQLNSKWRVNHIGNLGTVTVEFDITNVNLSGKQSCSNLQLVVDNDTNFSSPTSTYNLTISGNTATATGVVFTNNDYFTLRYIDQIVWDGTNFFNGSRVNNAPHTTNSCLKFTVKASGTLSLDANIREIEVETGATLNIANGVLLNIENQVVINGTLDLIGEAQLIQNHTGVTSNSGSGNLKIRQQGTSNLYNYNYWSSPVNRSGNWQIGYLEDANGVVNFTSAVDAKASTTPITLSSRWLYGFNGPVGDYNSWSQFLKTSNVVPGIGYTMKGSGTIASEQEYIFKGTPNDGDYIIPVTSNKEILIGNPYPSTLDANQFINDNLSVIDGAIYFWESFSTNNSHYLAEYEGGYATYNLTMPLPAVADASGLTSGNGNTSKPAPTRYVNVGQGFFTTITNTGNVRFNNAQRAFAKESSNETVYFKTNTKNKQAIIKDDRPKIWFSFTEPKGYMKMIGLGYDEKTSYGYDKGYDAKSKNDFKNDFYWFLNNQKLVIQALPEINIEDKLPLTVKISDAGSYTFSINNMENIPEDLNIYLVDNIQNIYYNLRNEDAKLFLNSETKSNQFSIAFKNESSLSTTSFDYKNLYTSYHSSTKTLELHTPESLSNFKSLKIYNVVGQEVLEINSPESHTINLSHLTNGVYFLKVNSETAEQINSIKFVKY
ncbi:T9SS type A sorting domain-containing protein [Mariniflexile litorale]|uniref:T9SS type A sorting domain-containing protein n=1 Tax=Mariniflexile litorale TaxID=3045158 RepID=A0AAU7EH89_9FLAO|nr:T9SS type A sorting domain-containing protein [Mariniflexile sp. KMM 9835]MDQ8210723.1 T9SS type A sorting domain-containing protein [Mariniflexile sp. KMM 9835]